MDSTKERRFRTVVEARVQWTLALRMILHYFVLLCACFLFALILQYLSCPLSSTREQLHALWKQSGPLLIAMICLIPVFVRDSLTLSNRVAGPVCRLRHTMKQIAAGHDEPPLAFRRTDMWDDLPDLFNAMVAQLRRPHACGSAEAAEELCDSESPTARG